MQQKLYSTSSYCMLKNSKEMILVLKIKKEDKNKNIREYMKKICLQMLFPANILLNSEFYTMHQVFLKSIVNRL